MKIQHGFARTLIALILLIAPASLVACSIVRAPTPTPPADFTPRPTPGGGSNVVDITATDFVQHALTIKRGTEVTFVIQLDSGPHILCLGMKGNCNAALPGPPELSQEGGFSVDAGQSLTVDFVAPGVYPITDSIYPSMNMVITVT